MSPTPPTTDPATLTAGIDALLRLAGERRVAAALSALEALEASATAGQQALLRPCRALLRWYAASPGGKQADGLQQAVEGVIRLQALGHEAALGWAYAAVGFGMGIAGHLERGLEWVERSIMATRSAGKPAEQRRSLSEKGALLTMARHHDLAQTVLLEALTLCDDSESGRTDTVTLRNKLAYGSVMWARSMEPGDERRQALGELAVEQAQQVLAGVEARGNWSRLRWPLASRGHAQALLGRHREAEASYREGLAIDGAPSRFRIDIAANYAALLNELGRYPEAELQLQAAADWQGAMYGGGAAVPLDDQDALVDRVMEVRVELYKRTGRTELALAWAERRFRRLERHTESCGRNVAMQAESMIELDRVRAAELESREEIAPATDQARRMDAAAAAKDQFLAHMSHEIRTPLNAILGLTQLLQRDPLPPREARHVAAILDAGDSLRRMIDDILDLSKMESGQLRIERLPMDLGGLLERVGKLLRPAAAAKGLAWRAQGPAQALGPVLGDAARLEQILLNLAGNAIKFTQTGWVALRALPVDSAGLALKLRFEVEDSGIGIAPEAVGTLFQPFTQADDGITRRYGGTGLGLAISQHLVQRMGGRIRVDSRPGRGSRFWFELSFEGSARRPAPAADAPAAGDEPALPALRVLAVDDNRLNRYTIERMLVREGARVELACNGQEALDRLVAGPADFDLVLMDVQMPVMDGLSATRAIRSHPRLRSLPVVALTAGATTPQREAARAAGVDGFVAKPLSRALLIAALRPWIPAPPLQQPAGRALDTARP